MRHLCFSFLVMGSDPTAKSCGTHSRSRFSRGLRTVPWTDGKGVQDEYAESVAENRNAIAVQKIWQNQSI